MVDRIWIVLGGKKAIMPSISSGEIGQKVSIRSLPRVEDAAGKERCDWLSFERRLLIIDDF